MRASRLRLAAIVLALLVVVGILLALRSGSHGHNTSTANQVPTPAATSSAPTASNSTQEPGTGDKPLHSAPPNGVVTDPNGVLKKKYPPSVKPDIQEDKVVTPIPSVVKTKLREFLVAYLTIKPHETDASRKARLEGLVSRRVLAQIDTSSANVAPDETMTPTVDTGKMLAQVTSDPNQLYITTPVDVAAQSEGMVYYRTVNTDTTWEYSRATKQWSLTHFYGAIVQQ